LWGGRPFLYPRERKGASERGREKKGGYAREEGLHHLYLEKKKKELKEKEERGKEDRSYLTLQNPLMEHRVVKKHYYHPSYANERRGERRKGLRRLFHHLEKKERPSFHPTGRGGIKGGKNSFKDH